MKVIDVSEHNGSINFDKVKASGVEGVIIRAGYGKGNIDKRFINNIKSAIIAGLHIGIYWFSYAYTSEMAKNEADHCLNIIKPYLKNIDLPVFFDWEYDSMMFSKKNGISQNKNTITKMNHLFCESIKAARLSAGFYSNLDYLNNYIDTSKLNGYVFWYAQYNKTCAVKCDMWQYTDKGRVSGILGYTDVNECYINIKPVVTVTETKPVTKTTKKYHTVKKGDTLSAIAKKYKTTVKKILTLNKSIEDPDLIYPGQKVRVK